MATGGEVVVCSADHNEGSGGSRQEAQDELECRAADAAGPGLSSVNLSTAPNWGKGGGEWGGENVLPIAIYLLRNSWT